MPVIRARSLYSRGGSGGGGQQLTGHFLDWRTSALESSDAALTENDKWDFVTGRVRNAAIELAPSGHGFPTLKVFHALATGLSTDGDGAAQISIAPDGNVANSPLPSVSVGSNRTFRWYLSYMMDGDIGDPFNHFYQDGGPVGQENWSVDTHGRNRISGTNFDDEQFYGMVQATESSAPWDFVNLGTGSELGGSFVYSTLARAHAYRIEVQIHRVDSTHHRMHTWVFDNATNGNALIYDDSDFVNRNNTGTLASNPLLETNIAENLRMPVFGCEGIGHNAPDWATPFDIFYMAGIGIVDGLPEGTPIGPYGTIVGEVLP